jgi:hypothetical protein
MRKGNRFLSNHPYNYLIQLALYNYLLCLLSELILCKNLYLISNSSFPLLSFTKHKKKFSFFASEQSNEVKRMKEINL